MLFDGEQKRLIAKSKLMAIYGKISDEEWEQQMQKVDQNQKPTFEKNVYLGAMQVGALHQKIKS